MSQWVQLFPVLLATFALLLLPGIFLGLLFRLRGIALWGFAAPITLSVIGISSLVLSLLRVPWSSVGVLVVALVLAGIVYLLQRAVFPRWFHATETVPSEKIVVENGWFRWFTYSLVAIASLLLMLRVGTAIGSPDNISQTFDNIFHLNAVRFILDTNDASPLKIGLMNSPVGNLGFYPSGWHALVSLVVQLTGASVVAATNITLVAVAGLVWVPGTVVLVRSFFGESALSTVTAAVVAGAFQSFPLFLMGYGVLYPMYLGFSMVPAALSLVVVIASRYVTEEQRYSVPADLAAKWLLLLGLIPGLAIVHPGAMMGVLCASVPIVTVWFFKAFQAARISGRKKVLRTVAIYGTYLIIGFALFIKVRPPRSQSTWQAVLDHSQGILNFLTLQFTEGHPPYVLAALTLLGVISAIADVVRRRKAVGVVLLLGYFMAFLMFFIVASVHHWGIRFWVLGIWYQNIPRIEAICVFFLLPIAAYGLLNLARGISSFVNNAKASRLLPAAISILALICIQSSLALSNMVSYVNQSYQYSKTSALVDTDELGLLMRLDKKVPEGVRIAGNGWTGAGMAYALSDRPVTMPHVMIDFTEDGILINDHLREARPGSPVCGAIKRLNVGYVLDFGNREVHGGRHIFPGIENLKESKAVKLADQVGHAKLYKVIGCI